MNHDVLADSRFQPKTDEYKRELDRTSFIALNREVASDAFPENGQYTPDPRNKEAVELKERVSAKKRQRYIEDLQADKLGIWLSGVNWDDVEAAKEVQGTLARTRSQQLFPTASKDVRCAEIEASYKDMMQGKSNPGGQASLHSSFTSLANRKSPASSQTTQRS